MPHGEAQAQTGVWVLGSARTASVLVRLIACLETSERVVGMSALHRQASALEIDIDGPDGMG